MLPVSRLAAVCLGMLAAGCTQPEVDRAGTWKATGVNEQNLRAMLANPQDAYVGSGALTARGDTGSRAVTRLLTDRRRPLLNASVSSIATPSGAQADTPLASGGGGGASGSAQ